MKSTTGKTEKPPPKQNQEPIMRSLTEQRKTQIEKINTGGRKKRNVKRKRKKEKGKRNKKNNTRDK